MPQIYFFNFQNKEHFLKKIFSIENLKNNTKVEKVPNLNLYTVVEKK